MTGCLPCVLKRLNRLTGYMNISKLHLNYLQDVQEIAQWLPAGYKQLDEEQHATAAEAMQNYVTSADLLKQLCQGGNNSNWLVNDPGLPKSSLHALACCLCIMNNVAKGSADSFTAFCSAFCCCQACQFGGAVCHPNPSCQTITHVGLIMHSVF